MRKYKFRLYTCPHKGSVVDKVVVTRGVGRRNRKCKLCGTNLIAKKVDGKNVTIIEYTHPHRLEVKELPTLIEATTEWTVRCGICREDKHPADVVQLVQWESFRKNTVLICGNCLATVYQKHLENWERDEVLVIRSKDLVT